MSMLCKSVNGLTDNHQVVGLGERCILCTFAAHVDNAFLEAHDFTSCYNRTSAKNVGPSASYGSNLGNNSWEHGARAFHLHTRLDNIFNRHDADALSGSCNIKLHGF